MYEGRGSLTFNDVPGNLFLNVLPDVADSLSDRMEEIELIESIASLISLVANNLDVFA